VAQQKKTDAARKGAPSKSVTSAEYREAERGVRIILGGKYPPKWIAEHATGLLSQANIEYAEWLEENRPAANPVGWLLNCVRWRARDLYDSEQRKPPTASIESFFHLADETTPDPEQQALENDRKRRLAEAISHLPPKEQKLLALVYYDGLSIREAGRRLGWRKSAADRHHKEAMEKMLALVGGDRRLLTPPWVGAAALAAVTSAAPLRGLTDAALTPFREAFAIATEAAEVGAHSAAELSRRVLPFTEAGNAAAASSAGRAVAQCGAAAGIAACGLLAAPTVERGIEAVLPSSPPPTRERTRAADVNPRPTPVETPPAPKAAAPPARPIAPADDPDPAPRQQRRPRVAADPPPASGAQTAQEFGDGAIAEPPPEEAAPEVESAAPPPPPPASGSQTAQEFGP
jgi:RNA polymerase sigma factor (sigma-70 family)